MNPLKQFYDKLSSDPNLAPSTVSVYYRLIKEMVERYGLDPSIEQLNEYIALKSKKRQYAVKFAVIKWMKDRWTDWPYRIQKLDKGVKRKEPKREKHYLSREDIERLISCINNKDHRLIMRLQADTGARASEIISLRVDKVYKEDAHNRIRLRITGKGDKVRDVFLISDKWELLSPYIEKRLKYFFISPKADLLTGSRLWATIETYYKRYYESLKEAQEELGIEFNSHDFRRTMADSILMQTGKIEIAQKALGHSRITTTMGYFKDRSEEAATAMLRHQENG